MEGGGRPFFFRNVLPGSGAGGFTLQDGDLGAVGGNGQKYGEGLYGIPPAGGGQDGETTVGR